MLIRPFADADEDAVVALWRAAGLVRPWNDPHRDIDRKKRVQRDLFLVAEDAGALVGTAMAGYDGHRGWVYYVAVAPDRQGTGIGRLLMAEVEARLLALGCPKTNVLVRSGNEAVTAFYERLGYTADAAVGLGKRLIPDD
ncbi:GNAT family acetyltransferase [Amnibacterium endophyticum]|uniref:GNAT family acetyltransferase n=1 Tax=Amnibacterium endophyticum TaxID=2109337 RepID=A0ABW4LDB5_9MICO